jgi:predicted Co/Zn/Cd cation transporter (cation efflux family)
MEGFGEFVAWVLSLVVLIVFFILVDRVGEILKGIRELQREAAEQTRYLSVISTNLAKVIREREPTPGGQ